MITAEEEVELSVRIRNGDTDALEKLVVANLRFVISVAKQYQNQGLSFPDLINEGNVGLVKAASKFDEKRGFKFISYAVWWIRQSIIQAISEQTRIVRLPLNRLSSINKISKAIPYLEQQYEREPSDEELAEFLEINEDDVKRANYVKKRQVSFDKPLAQDGGSETNLYEFIHNSNTPPPDNSVMHESDIFNINRALKKLTQKEAEIISMSYGLNNTQVQSLYDIAAKFGMSSERVRQIRGAALTKLKRMMSGKSAFME
jgi:RNA polymerase primary sigma factor